MIAADMLWLEQAIGREVLGLSSESQIQYAVYGAGAFFLVLKFWKIISWTLGIGLILLLIGLFQ